MKTTLRKLITLALKGIQTEFLTESEIEKFANYILDNSTLTITNTTINLESGSIFGVGDSNKDREFELPRYLTFYLGDYNFETPNSKRMMEGTPQRQWQMCSYDSFTKLERELVIAGTGCFDALQDGNLVILIDGKIEGYKVVETQGILGFMQRFVVWNTIKPYVISYVTVSGVGENEYHNSRYELDERVISLINQSVTGLQVCSTYDNKLLNFIVTKTEYCSNKPNNNGEQSVTWIELDWGCDDEGEYEN